MNLWVKVKYINLHQLDTMLKFSWAVYLFAPTIFPVKKKKCDRDFNTGPLNPKSAMLAPRPQIDGKFL